MVTTWFRLALRVLRFGTSPSTLQRSSKIRHFDRILFPYLKDPVSFMLGCNSSMLAPDSRQPRILNPTTTSYGPGGQAQLTTRLEMPPELASILGSHWPPRACRQLHRQAATTRYTETQNTSTGAARKARSGAVLEELQTHSSKHF